MRHPVVPALCLAIVTLAPDPALARSACAPRDIVLDCLATSYGETRRSVGLGSNNQMIEVFASSETGSWTITVTRPGGLTCLVASGEAFETLAEDLPENDHDA